MNKVKKLLLISSALLLSAANNTFAQSSGSISASGTVTGSCTVTASAMTFTALGTAGTDTAISTVTPTCSEGTPYTVTNAGNTNSLFLGGSSGAGANGTILFPITLTGGSTTFTLLNAATGKLTGTGTGSASANETTLTGTAASSTGKTAGLYSGSVTLTISY
jgi:spore coat protein U-like protein